jgi:hypothetical protein
MSLLSDGHRGMDSEDHTLLPLPLHGSLEVVVAEVEYMGPDNHRQDTYEVDTVLHTLYRTEVAVVMQLHILEAHARNHTALEALLLRACEA